MVWVGWGGVCVGGWWWWGGCTCGGDSSTLICEMAVLRRHRAVLSTAPVVSRGIRARVMAALLRASTLARVPTSGAIDPVPASAEQNEAIAQALRQICEVNPNATMCPAACTDKTYRHHVGQNPELSLWFPDQQPLSDTECSLPEQIRDMRLHGRAGEACPDWALLCCDPAPRTLSSSVCDTEPYPIDDACSQNNLFSLSKASGEVTHDEYEKLQTFVDHLSRRSWCESRSVCPQALINLGGDCIVRALKPDMITCRCWNETATPCGLSGMEWKGVNCNLGNKQFAWSL